jgi:hypothetical protein
MFDTDSPHLLGDPQLPAPLDQETIVRLVREGSDRVTLAAWVEVVSGVDLMTLPMSVDGIYVGVSARTAQRLADILGCTLPSAKLFDLGYLAAKHQLEPVTYAPGSKHRFVCLGGRRVVVSDIGAWEVIVEHTIAVGVQLAAFGAQPGELVMGQDKAWILDAGTKQGRGCNYGFYSARAPNRAVSPGLTLWQSVGTAHNLEHQDYSQSFRPARLRDGAVLPTHSDPAPARYPGVDPEPARAVPVDPADPAPALDSGPSAKPASPKGWRRG